MAIYSLPDQDVVRVSGPDARKLLNDTLTSRFDDGLKGAGRWFALLSPQGKVQVEGLVTEAEDGFWFTLPAALTADFIKRMKLYRLRAKVEIEPKPELGVFWTPDNSGTNDARLAFRDERAGSLGVRLIQPRDAAADESDTAYHAARIAAGVPASRSPTISGAPAAAPSGTPVTITGRRRAVPRCCIRLTTSWPT
jgi:folate-binding Fe-S cluster repair protein YgfZ